MELNPKSTESIIEVNLSLELNYNKLPHLLLNSNCGNWKTVYIYKKNTGRGRKHNSCHLTWPLSSSIKLTLFNWRVIIFSELLRRSIIESFLYRAPVDSENYWNEVLQLNKFSVQFGRGVLRWKPIWSLGLKQTGLVSALAPAPSNALTARGQSAWKRLGPPGASRVLYLTLSAQTNL